MKINKNFEYGQEIQLFIKPIDIPQYKSFEIQGHHQILFRNDKFSILVFSSTIKMSKNQLLIKIIRLTLFDDSVFEKFSSVISMVRVAKRNHGKSGGSFGVKIFMRATDESTFRDVAQLLTYKHIIYPEWSYIRLRCVVWLLGKRSDV